MIQEDRVWAYFQHDLKQPTKPLKWQQEPLEETIDPIQYTLDDKRNDQSDQRYIGQRENRSHFHTIMSGRGKKGRGRGGRGAHRGRGNGRGNNYPSHINNLNNNNKGLCSTMGHHVFGYGHKEATYKMRTTWENTINHVRAIYVHNIIN